MSDQIDCAIIGKWRIVEADLWDREYLDMLGPAYFTFGGDGHGKFAFGVVNGGLDCGYGQTVIFFTWEGSDEMDEVRGDGAAQLEDDGSLSIEFRYHLGDEAEFKAHRW